MDEAYKLQHMVAQIDKTLATKNLTPEQRTAFLNMQSHLKEKIRKHIEDDIKRQIRSEITRQMESDMGPLAGESYGESPGLRIPNQEGAGVKTYGSDSPAVGIREFHRNLTYGQDRGAIPPRVLDLRRLLMSGRTSRI